MSLIKRTITLYTTPDTLRSIATFLDRKMKSTSLGEDIPKAYFLHDTDEKVVYEFSIDQDKWQSEQLAKRKGS